MVPDKRTTDEFEKFLVAMAKIMKHTLKKHDRFMCPEFKKLDQIAFDHLGKPNASMHRRAVMQHPFKCDHEQCKELAKFMISTGFDKMCHPSYGLMLDTQKRDQTKTDEELK